MTSWLGLGLVWALTGLAEVLLGTLLELFAGMLCGPVLGIGPGPGRSLLLSLSRLVVVSAVLLVLQAKTPDGGRMKA